MTIHTATFWLPLLREALAHEGRFRFPLRGASMRPTLPVACEIEIAPQPSCVPLGSLVVFANGDALVAHRLVRRKGDVWITQGDGRLAPDRPLAQAQVLGVVTAAHRDGRRIWPGAAEGVVRWFWLARYHLLRPLRFARRCLRAVLRR